MRSLCVLALLVFISCATATTPPAATGRLETTPRHDEWVRIDRGNGRTLHAYVTYPERATPAPAIVLIHENRGLNDWARSVADRLSENGYLVIAPDLLSGWAPGGGKTSDFPTQDAAREAISKLQLPDVLADLNAAADYIKRDASASGKLFVAGFCWGGSRSFQFANVRNDLSGAFVFYGSGPQDEAGVMNIVAPVFGFYGGNDARVNATIPKTQELMAAAGKRFEPVTYDGAGHAFMREGVSAEASEANRQAMTQAWERWLGLMRGL